MDANLDIELRDAFLVEAGDLLQKLNEQLIELESSPHDSELLNAVFRVFHTVKGGAGFLAVDPMVQLCHCAEELLNDARHARVVLDATHMDALLETLDLLNMMMEQLASSSPIAQPPQALLHRLHPPAHAKATQPVKAIDPIEAEFEAILEQQQRAQSKAEEPTHIDDSEFEALLDNLYGGGAPGAPAPASKNNQEISEDEFEALLDNLHGKGAAPAGMATAVAAAPAPAPAEPARAAVPAKPQAENTVRVDTARLDTLVSRAGELVLLRNRLLSLAARSEHEALSNMAGDLDRVSDDLQNAVLGMRMQPVGRLFQRFPRIVRDLARQLGKEIELIQEGEDTNLDRSLVEALADPLIHLLRNAVDHGLEDPAGRDRAGKPHKGKVRLSASQRGERIVISVSDDGRGMDPEVLRRKAVEKGVIDATQAARLSEVECYELIFRPGFSTAAQISDISGRGVGMDVVKTRVAELGGTLQVHSRLGHGSTLELTVPLTLAILRVLMVRSGDRLFALPLGNVSEVFELNPQHDHMLDGRRVAAHRGRALVLGDLGTWAGVKESSGTHIVVLHVGHMHLGCLVDEVLGREDVMVKPLGPLFEGIPGVAGATVTGDGRLALVLDLAALSQEGGPLLPSLRVSA
ncbi:chemotaxis protein CheA [Dyella dinghuensis]|uniref:Chemotaxis protein CheA n=1 Tax=Dyella dinghuensis TaxID=1920169 RepID=A0A432LQX8_9GAMM|nr:chemotaxis protein CheA [Dyella dinghuensis]RUL62959.1 chemotaxis protein CheA [Dyella dinghuensis]